MTSFAEQVYRICKQVPQGKVASYKQIAEALGTKAYQAVGQALNKNPYREVPCHRIINAKGELHGFAQGLKKKQRLLEAEGIQIVQGKVDLKKFGMHWKSQS